jgi:Mg-chelatase subunit ChlD
MENKPMSVLDVNNVLNVCKRRCDDMGVRVEFDQWADTAYTTETTITLPPVTHPVTQEAVDRLYGLVIHECGHHLRPQALKILNKVRPPEHVCGLFNIVEDDGMERDRANAWLGDRKALATMNNIVIGKIVEGAKEHGVNNNIDMAPIACLAIYQESRLNWDKESVDNVAAYIDVLPPKAKQLYGELRDEGYVDKFRATVNEYDCWNLAIDLAKRLYPGKDEEYEKLREAAGTMPDPDAVEEPKAPPRDTSGDTFEDAHGKEGEPEQLGEDSDSDDEGAPQEGRVISWKDVVLSEHDEWKSSGEKSNGGFGIDWEGYHDKRGVSLMPTSKVNVVDLEYKGGSLGTWRESPKNFMGDHSETRAFANQIRRYIQAQARTKMNPEQYSGRLNRSAIVRLALPPVDGGEYNKRLFYNQTKQEMKDTAIFVLTDWSGSMCGAKMEYAADASQRLVHTFERQLRVPVALALFSNRRSECDIGYVKRFNTRGTKQQDIADRFSKFCNYSSGNNDADAVNWAYNELLKRKESRKILMVLSDGSPTGSYKGNPGTALRFITDKIQKDHKIEMWGVGIRSEAVKGYYNNYVVIDDPTQINHELFTIIKDGYNEYRRG